MANQWAAYRIERPHQYKTLAPGEGDFIFEVTIPDGQYGFIQYVGSNYYDGCYFKWYVDNEDVEGEIRRQMASVAQPTKIDPPIKFEKIVKVYAYNGDTESHVMEWLCDGVIYRRNG